jgi:hypothetical protein
MMAWKNYDQQQLHTRPHPTEIRAIAKFSRGTESANTGNGNPSNFVSNNTFHFGGHSSSSHNNNSSVGASSLLGSAGLGAAAAGAGAGGGAGLVPRTSDSSGGTGGICADEITSDMIAEMDDELGDDDDFDDDEDSDVDDLDDTDRDGNPERDERDADGRAVSAEGPLSHRSRSTSSGSGAVIARSTDRGQSSSGAAPGAPAMRRQVTSGTDASAGDDIDAGMERLDDDDGDVDEDDGDDDDGHDGPSMDGDDEDDDEDDDVDDEDIADLAPVGKSAKTMSYGRNKPLQQQSAGGAMNSARSYGSSSNGSSHSSSMNSVLVLGSEDDVNKVTPRSGDDSLNANFKGISGSLLKHKWAGTLSKLSAGVNAAVAANRSGGGSSNNSNQTFATFSQPSFFASNNKKTKYDIVLTPIIPDKMGQEVTFHLKLEICKPNKHEIFNNSSSATSSMVGRDIRDLRELTEVGGGSGSAGNGNGNGNGNGSVNGSGSGNGIAVAAGGSPFAGASSSSSSDSSAAYLPLSTASINAARSPPELRQLQPQGPRLSQQTPGQQQPQFLGQFSPQAPNGMHAMHQQRSPQAQAQAQAQAVATHPAMMGMGPAAYRRGTSTSSIESDAISELTALKNQPVIDFSAAAALHQRQQQQLQLQLQLQHQQHAGGPPSAVNMSSLPMPITALTPPQHQQFPSSALMHHLMNGAGATSGNGAAGIGRPMYSGGVPGQRGLGGSGGGGMANLDRIGAMERMGGGMGALGGVHPFDPMQFGSPDSTPFGHAQSPLYGNPLAAARGLYAAPLPYAHMMMGALGGGPGPGPGLGAGEENNGGHGMMAAATRGPPNGLSGLGGDGGVGNHKSPTNQQLLQHQQQQRLQQQHYQQQQQQQQQQQHQQRR